MAVYDVVQYPDDPLTLKAEPFEEVGPEIQQLAQDMFETMNAHEGVGLAGPQIGLSKRILVLHDPEGEPKCLINPEILEKEGSDVCEEGCLSLPQLYAPVERATRIRVRALNEFGEALDFEAHDFEARIIQHEYDHLDGICFPDRINIFDRTALLQEWDELRNEVTAQPNS